MLFINDSDIWVAGEVSLGMLGAKAEVWQFSPVVLVTFCVSFVLWTLTWDQICQKEISIFFKVKNNVQFLLIFSVTVTGSGVSLTQGCVCEWHIYKSKHAAQRNLKKCEKRYCDGCSGSCPTLSTTPEHKLSSLLWNTWVFWTYGFQY